MQVHTDASSTRQNGDRWHSDVSCDEEPPMGSVLHLHTVPEHGGDTLFSSMYAAWDALSEPMKKLLAPLEARHESAHLFDHLYGDEMVRRRNEWPSAAHPVVRTHPETGRKALFVNSIFTRRILGVTESESRALLEFLFEHVSNPHFQCRFRWRRNSIAFWDNRCVQHHAMWDYYPATRSGTRVTVAGDRPYH
jgi:taurine dioxygenase